MPSRAITVTACGLRELTAAAGNLALERLGPGELAVGPGRRDGDQA